MASGSNGPDTHGGGVGKLQAAESVNDLLDAVDRKVAKAVTPNIVPKGAMVLQPSDERRRSGSHYTPRSLTEPIGRTALRPIIERLGDRPTPEQILDLKVCDPAMGSGAFLVEACRQLGDELVKAWHVHDRLPAIPPDEDEVLHARRRVAQRCLYGVDKNPLAVDLAKLSLWLATLAKDHPFTFLDHSLRCGDSLVGLSREQIIRFHWKPGAQSALDEDRIRDRLERATEYRRRILENAEGTPYLLLQQHLALADEALTFVRLVGDAVVSAFFAATSDRDREDRRDELFSRLSAFVRSGLMPALEQPLGGAAKWLRTGEKAIEPFHWEIEFPEVMTRENCGFDAVVGNPPFAGKNSLINSNPNGYLEWLKAIHEESHGNADQVAHFFRRAFNLIRHGGAFGLIATNTIGQGDTRSTGLQWICTHGGTIFAARRRYKWPGMAAVVVSVIHIAKGPYNGRAELNGSQVERITAFLFHRGGHDDPQRLVANADKSFIGSYVLGMGFTFDDTDRNGVATPLTEMRRLIAKDPRNTERIFPYIGGEEVNTSPTHAHHRYVINFEEMTEAEARRWPDLMAILEERVKPERSKLTGNADAKRRRERWWLWGRYTPALFRAIQIRTLERVLVNSQVSSHLAFAFLPGTCIYSHTLNVFPSSSYRLFCVLQSRVHEIWSRFFGSSLEDRMRYTPSDCFETFPFPENFQTDERLEVVGKDYYEVRGQLMVKNNEGLTKTYNRFHNLNDCSAEIKRLRERHAAMDLAVLDTYGWTDLKATCEFLPDYEEEDDEDDSATRRRKKPWRYRWPDNFRDEVLARLLELNKQRAEEERLAGIAADADAGKRANAKRAPRAGRKKNQAGQGSLAGM